MKRDPSVRRGSGGVFIGCVGPALTAAAAVAVAATMTFVAEAAGQTYLFVNNVSKQ